MIIEASTADLFSLIFTTHGVTGNRRVTYGGIEGVLKDARRVGREAAAHAQAGREALAHVPAHRCRRQLKNPVACRLYLRCLCVLLACLAVVCS